ncbi:major facilitator superfamily domain-containing protein [Fennellomyces sp. T-0311]|nr:major facilitator superfamily domain-containing protein [Fennellomyces sp. T-0311]
MTDNVNTEGKQQLRHTSTGSVHESSAYVDEKSDSSANAVVVHENADKSLDTHWSAWVAVSCVIAVNVACIIMWTTASNAPVSFMEWLQCDYNKLNWLSNVAAISNATFSIVAAWAYERFGPKACVAACGCLNLLGCWIRCIGILLSPEKRYPMMMLGQAIASTGGPFVYNLSRYGLRQSIAQLVVCLQLLIVAIVATVCAIPVMFIPQKPPHAPSLSAMAERITVWQGFKMVSKNFQFWSICIVSTMTVGMYSTVSIVMVLAALPYGYNEREAGIGIALLIASGFVGGGVFIVENAYGPFLCVNILIGIFGTGIFPIQLEYACDMFYPVPESVISNIIWSLGTALMSILTVIATELIAGPDANPPNNLDMSLVAMAAIFVAGSIPCIWLKGDMKRVAADEEATLS